MEMPARPIENELDECYDATGPAVTSETSSSETDSDSEEGEFVFEWEFPDVLRHVEDSLQQSTSADEPLKLFSPSFRAPDGAEWCMMLFPAVVKEGSVYLSVFLQLVNCRELALKDRFFFRDVDFTLKAVNFSDRALSVQSSASHKFSESSQDWGFRLFLDLSQRAKLVPALVNGKPSFDVKGALETGFLRMVEGNDTKALIPATRSPRLSTGPEKASNACGQKLEEGASAAGVAPSSSEDAREFSDLKNQLTMDAATASDAMCPPSGSPRLTISLRATVTPTMRWRMDHYDSKSKTGMVGLKNAGATCYLNSLLQTLYHTRQFRQLVYDLRTEDDSATEGVAFALQRLFWQLQVEARALPTRRLTRAFGWTNHQCFTQHDVQELNRELCDKLESRMKGTPQEGAIGKLFTGQYRSYIKTLNPACNGFMSFRDEQYYDVQLDVKGCANVIESFEKYTEQERLDGENQYEAEVRPGEKVMTDALKGMSFLSFPPVLHLQLKRFAYDFQTDQTVKINDRYEFPLELNLSKFVAKEGFVLHSVLVHSGDIHSGHYYAFIRPGLFADHREEEERQCKDVSTRVDGSEGTGTENKTERIQSKTSRRRRKRPAWYKFDDETVMRVPSKEAIDANFGGERSTIGGRRKLGFTWASAYMLVYIRKRDLGTVMARLPLSRIPASLKTRLHQEKEQQQQHAKEKREAHLFATVRVLRQTVERREILRGMDSLIFYPPLPHEKANESASSLEGKIVDSWAKARWDRCQWGAEDAGAWKTSAVKLKLNLEWTMLEAYRVILRNVGILPCDDGGGAEGRSEPVFESDFVPALWSVISRENQTFRVEALRCSAAYAKQVVFRKGILMKTQSLGIPLKSCKRRVCCSRRDLFEDVKSIQLKLAAHRRLYRERDALGNRRHRWNANYHRRHSPYNDDDSMVDNVADDETAMRGDSMQQPRVQSSLGNSDKGQGIESCAEGGNGFEARTLDDPDDEELKKILPREAREYLRLISVRQWIEFCTKSFYNEAKQANSVSLQLWVQERPPVHAELVSQSHPICDYEIDPAAGEEVQPPAKQPRFLEVSECDTDTAMDDQSPREASYAVKSSVLLFCRLFVPSEGCSDENMLKAVGEVLVPSVKYTLGSLLPAMRKAAGLPPGAPLMVWEQLTPRQASNRIELSKSLEEADLMSGDVFCLQHAWWCSSQAEANDFTGADPNNYHDGIGGGGDDVRSDPDDVGGFFQQKSGDDNLDLHIVAEKEERKKHRRRSREFPVLFPDWYDSVINRCAVEFYPLGRLGIDGVTPCTPHELDQIALPKESEELASRGSQAKGSEEYRSFMAERESNGIYTLVVDTRLTIPDSMVILARRINAAGPRRADAESIQLTQPREQGINLNPKKFPMNPHFMLRKGTPYPQGFGYSTPTRSIESKLALAIKSPNQTYRSIFEDDGTLSQLPRLYYDLLPCKTERLMTGGLLTAEVHFRTEEAAANAGLVESAEGSASTDTLCASRLRVSSSSPIPQSAPANLGTGTTPFRRIRMLVDRTNGTMAELLEQVLHVLNNDLPSTLDSNTTFSWSQVPPHAGVFWPVDNARTSRVSTADLHSSMNNNRNSNMSAEFRLVLEVLPREEADPIREALQACEALSVTDDVAERPGPPLSTLLDFRYILVTHFTTSDNSIDDGNDRYRATPQAHGEPFIMRIGVTETLRAFMERLRLRLGISPSLFKLYRPAILDRRVYEFEMLDRSRPQEQRTWSRPRASIGMADGSVTDGDGEQEWKDTNPSLSFDRDIGVTDQDHDVNESPGEDYGGYGRSYEDDYDCANDDPRPASPTQPPPRSPAGVGELNDEHLVSPSERLNNGTPCVALIVALCTNRVDPFRASPPLLAIRSLLEIMDERRFVEDEDDEDDLFLHSYRRHGRGLRTRWGNGARYSDALPTAGEPEHTSLLDVRRLYHRIPLFGLRHANQDRQRWSMHRDVGGISIRGT